MATSTLKILREVNNYTQEYIAEDVLGISQPTYARIEQSPDRISAEQAQKLSDLYKVSIANLLSEATPIITFQNNAINNNPNGNGLGYIQTQNNHINQSDLFSAIQQQNELLIKQNGELMELIKLIKTK